MSSGDIMMKILIIGGGIGGLSTTIALQRLGFDAHVYESAVEVQPVGKGIWVPTNAMLVLERLGLSDAVVRSGLPLERIEVHDQKDGVLLRLNLHHVQAKYRYTTVSIQRAQLHKVFLEHVRPGTLHLGKRCTGLTQAQDGVTVQFQDGTQVAGDVLVGADGIHSVIRQALFPDAALRYSGQTCYRGIAIMDLPPSLARTCWEVWGGESRFGFSALGPRQVYWFAPITAPAGSVEQEGTLFEQLAERYAGFPAPIPDIIARTPMDELIRTDLYDLLPLTRWWHGRVILLGDAAHAMTPNLGQGGAQAIEDAFLLAHTLSSSGSLREAFREYERVRRPRVRRMVHTAWRHGQIAHIRSRWGQRLRNVAMQSVPDWVNQKRVEWLYALHD
jgi:2-polyprenyl-6-methoxyphenol hydroxylase-like FAD-dependent oxidoreductase